MMEGSGWLSVHPTSGDVAAGSCLNISALFNAYRLPSGLHNSTLIISSNDSASAIVRVPAHLLVTPAPDIAVSRDSIDFGDVYVTAAKPETLQVINEGTEVLTVRHLVIQTLDHVAPSFNVDTAGFNVDPGDTQEIEVIFAPPAVGNIRGSLTIESNDLDESSVTVLLKGKATNPESLSIVV